MKKDTKLILIVLAGILAIVLLCVFAVQGTQNKAFTLEEQVNTAQSDIRVQEKRRVDLVYNLADCVMQYDKHEAETLTAIVEGRGSSGDIENVTTSITAVSEAYPELKANENYKELMNELSITENLIAEYRSNFNKQVKEYNRYVRQFPALRCTKSQQRNLHWMISVTSIWLMTSMSVLKSEEPITEIRGPWKSLA